MVPESVLHAFNLICYTGIQPITAGLINQSYCITLQTEEAYLLQQINTSVFSRPLVLQENYIEIHAHLANKNAFQLPGIRRTQQGGLLYCENGNAWRCTQFVHNAYSPVRVNSAEKAYEVASCFGSFTAQLHDLPVEKLTTVLPRFHDLQYRFEQLQQALHQAAADRVKKASACLQPVYNSAHLLQWYNRISTQPEAYPLRIMHHDCKISNILFDKSTDALRCPIDLDTTQPGLFFSDMGDMLRSMAPTVDENCTRLEDLHIQPLFYDAVVQGYTDAMSPYLTSFEIKDLHYAGAVLVYMQAIRFLTDYLNGNLYYKVTYDDQNLDRTANQLRLLNLMQAYTSGHAHSKP